MCAVSGCLTDTARVQRGGLCAILTIAISAPHRVSMVLGHPSHLWGEASWHLPDLESGRNDVVCVRLEAWTHSPHHLPPVPPQHGPRASGGSEDANSPSVQDPSPFLSWISSLHKYQGNTARCKDAKVVLPIPWASCTARATLALHPTPQLCSLLPKPQEFAPQALAHGGATVGPSLLLDLGSTKARENAGWKNIKWIFFLSSF